MPESEKTDEQIAAAVQAGDVESFGFLVERFEPKLQRYARKFLFSPEEAEDLVQDVFMKAYMNIRSLDTSRRVSPWLYRIAHNEFLNALKKKKREKVSFFNLDILFPHPVANETADSDLQKKEVAALVEECLAELDPKYREPLVLYYIEDMDYQAIADILQIPRSTVGVRLQRGKLQLKKIVSKTDPLYV